MDDISETLINQRIRNRIIEVFNVYSSIENQEYVGATEAICLWEDIVDNIRLVRYTEPVFTEEEQRLIKAFHNKWLQVCNSTPQDMPPVAELLKYSGWQELMAIADEAKLVFSKRGNLDEENEIA